MKKLDEKQLRLLELEPAVLPGPVMDAAESHWDPWLLALARIEASNGARPN